VFVLRDLHELSIREVAAITGMSSGAIKTNLSHARKKLRQWFDAGAAGERESAREMTGDEMQVL
jgi:DNA-directed RNA polymerase specialized sigma24 family protein